MNISLRWPIAKILNAIRLKKNERRNLWQSLSAMAGSDDAADAIEVGFGHGGVGGEA
jgi:tRNA G46 methylase TrmB